MLLQRADGRAQPHLLAEPVHDLDAGQVALVNGAIVALAGKGFLVDAAVRVAVEEAAVAAFQLQDAPRRLGDEGPDELLVVDPAAARQGVVEVRVEGVGGGEHGVVAALDHPRAAGAPEQPLDDDGHGEMRRAIGCVQRRAEPGAAGAQNEKIGLEEVDRGLHAQQAADKGLAASFDWKRLGASLRHPSTYTEYASGCRGARRLASGPFSTACAVGRRLASGPCSAACEYFRILLDQLDLCHAVEVPTVAVMAE